MSGWSASFRSLSKYLILYSSKMRFFFLLILIGGSSVSLPLLVRGDDEICNSCQGEVQADGQFTHYKNPAATFRNAAGNESAFQEELTGSNFTITVSHLPAGKYSIAIGEVEILYTNTGQRIFGVTASDAVLATNFDIFATAKGINKVCYILGRVQHSDDSIDGPLTISFVSKRGDAKFNTLEIKDMSGASVVSLNASDLANPMAAAAKQIPVVSGPKIWKDPSQPIDLRVNDLISRMSLAEKAQQMVNSTPAIPRLGIPAYNYWSEALHGVASAGVATVFPQAIGMAATWDPSLIHNEADTIATEGRAKFNDYASQHNGDTKGRFGLTFWSPNVNIFRDPRWGRGQETYGEDPFLTGTLAVSFIEGLQGDDPKYIKAMACAKHFAVHSGPEPIRHRFDAEPPERDFYETYLPQFEMTVREGHVGGVMGAYNSIFGKPACANTFLLNDILREDWGFKGYIVSDCGAIHDIWTSHHFADTPEEADADAIKAGCDICCGKDYNALLLGVQKGLVKENEINRALAYGLKPRFQLGLFDPPQDVPWSNVGIDQNDTLEHAVLALKVAEESIVLLKNEGTLPLDRQKVKHIAVIGENANSVPVLVGTYNGVPSHPITILDGIKQVAGPNIEVSYAQGCPIALLKDGINAPTSKMWSDALALAKTADVIIYVGGISGEYEGEENKRANGFNGFAGGDRTQIELPSVQTDLIKALYHTGRPVVFVNCSGSAIAMPWESKHLPAIVQAWYPGEQGGKAVGEVLFGDVNPAGRLPVTFYKSTDDLPGFEDYSMKNRTYRYFTGKPLFAFGHGLSYTKFEYADAKLASSTITPDGTVKISFALQNTGYRDGDEVAQVYFRHVKSAVTQPNEALCGFIRIHLPESNTARVTLSIPAERFRYWDTTRKVYVVEPGKYQLLIGGASDDIQLKVPFEIPTQISKK